jgi:exportin-T
MVTVARPALGELLSGVLEAVLRVPVAAPRHKAIRARVTGVIHRYVEVLGPGLLPYAPRALEALIYEGIDAADAGDVLALLVQLLCRCKEAVAPICERAVGPVLELVHGLLPPEWDWSGRTGADADGAPAHADATGTTEEMRERADLQRSYYALLAALTGQGLTSTLAHLSSATFDRCMQVGPLSLMHCFFMSPFWSRQRMLRVPALFYFLGLAEC